MRSLRLPEGAQIYRVGGSVRDELLGRKPKDADYVAFGIELGDLRYAVQRADARTSKLQLRDRRVVGVRAQRRGLGLVEIVLPRKEVSTGPGHRDFEIIVDPSLPMEDDARRRDFSFNALYRNILTGEVLDPTRTGLYDLQHKLIRTTDPFSFRDDPLRTLRALRFVSTLGYDLTADSFEQMRTHAQFVTGLTDKGVSGTVLEELSKLLMGDEPEKALKLAVETGVLHVLLPEMAPLFGFEQRSRYHDFTADKHTFKAIHAAALVGAPLRVRLALLLHDIGKPATLWEDAAGHKHYYAHPKNGCRSHEAVGAQMAREILTRLNAPKDLRRDVVTLIEHHMLKLDGTIRNSDVGRMRVALGDSLFRDLIMHRACDISGKNRINEEQFLHLQQLEALRDHFEKLEIPISTNDLEIDGFDLKQMGVEGPAIGRVLRMILDEVVCQPKEPMLERYWQLNRAETLARKGSNG